MSNKTIKLMAAASAIALCAPLSAGAAEIIFQNDFENGLGANEFIAIDPGEGSSGIDTRWVSCTFSLCGKAETWGTGPDSSGTTQSVRNFDVHDRSTNPGAGGNNLSGQVLGHVYANYDAHEDNYYQIDNISLNAALTDISLMFEFDSWIRSDSPDGFAVAISDNGGSSWSLLNPTASSDMQYANIGTIGDSSLNALTGQPTSSGSVIRGFDGFDSAGNMIDMAGTAMFDIANTYAGSTISLRFAFASGASSQAEGINIDGVKVTGVCISGSGPDCDDPPSGGDIPEPGSLALAMLGVAAAYRTRKRKNA
jgi:hypothetical protein